MCVKSLHGRASPSASQLLAFSPGQEQAVGAPSQGRWDPDSLRPALSLGGQATAWEDSPGRSLCLTKTHPLFPGPCLKKEKGSFKSSP